MSNAVPQKKNPYILGGLLLLAMLIGGGTAAGLVTDTLLQILMIAGSSYVLLTTPAGKADRLLQAFSCFLVLMVAVQVVPLPVPLITALQAPVWRIQALVPPGDWGFLSINPFRTLDSLVYLSALLMFFSALTRLSERQVMKLIPFFLLGLLFNLLLGILQFSLSAEPGSSGLLPYTVKAGIFANTNHYATLLFSALPLVIYCGFYLGMKRILLVVAALILLLLLASGSIAGVLIGAAAVLLSVFFMAGRGRRGVLLGISLLLAAAAYSWGIWHRVSSEGLENTFGRLEFARTTLDGIKANILTGTGYGSFDTAYPVYERRSMIFSEYVNHAHNDYLEIILEGGVCAVGALALYALLLAGRMIRASHDPFLRSISLSLSFILVHSFVDYPLRTMAVATLFAFLNGILFSRSRNVGEERNIA